MAIRVGYPKVGAGQPDIRTPRQEPEVIDVRCVPSQRVIRPSEPDPSSRIRQSRIRQSLNRQSPNRQRPASGPGRTDHRLTAH